MLSSIAACHFNPATLLRPAGGKDCLTAQQLKMVETFATGQRTEHPLWNDVQTMPGFNVLAGADLTGPMDLMHRAEQPTRILLNSFHYVVGNQVLRPFLTGDPHFNTLCFDTKTGGKYAADLLPQSEASDASNGNLAAFAQHGGKFLMLHGAADAIIPIGSSALYEPAGDGPLSALLSRPGYGHGRCVFNAGFDALGLLDRWLDTGAAPKNLVVVDNNKSGNGRTRPLCVYPAWPRYSSAADVNAAASFTCATE